MAALIGMWWVRLGLNLGSQWVEAPHFHQHPKTGDQRAWEVLALGSVPGMEMGAPPCPMAPQDWDEPTLGGTLQAGMWQLQLCFKPEFLPHSSLQGREEEEEEEEKIWAREEEDRAGRMRRMKAWEQGVRSRSKEEDEGLRSREEQGSGQGGQESGRRKRMGQGGR